MLYAFLSYSTINILIQIIDIVSSVIQFTYVHVQRITNYKFESILFHPFKSVYNIILVCLPQDFLYYLYNLVITKFVTIDEIIMKIDKLINLKLVREKTFNVVYYPIGKRLFLGTPVTNSL